LFWFSYHTDFSKFSRKKSRGKQVGVSKIVTALASVVGPIAGGIILSFFGFKVLFLLVSFLLIASTFPLFLSKEIHEPSEF
jgi:MFS family permease